MDVFRDKHLLTKEFFEKKRKTPDEETLSQQLQLTPSQPVVEDESEQDKEPPGRVLGHEVLQGKIVALYFSAGWCPPCQSFTPLLCGLYDELRNRKANFEVVFLSFDKREEDMETYFLTKHRDWFVLPFDDPLKDELKLKYNVTAVPRLIVIHSDGEVLTPKGRKEVQDKGVICYRNWQQISTVYEGKLMQAAAAAAAAMETQTETGDEKTEGVQNGGDFKIVGLAL